MIRCDACGAANGDAADWCGQCYASLRTATEDAPEPVATAPTRGSPANADRVSEPAAEGFRRSGDTVEWECPACGEWSTVEAFQCRVCATPLTARWLREDADDRMPATGRLDEPWTAALALSAVIPGAGHIGLRQYGSGFGRAVLFGVWLMGGVALLVSGGVLAAAPLLLGAAVLWAGSLYDIIALRAGRQEVLGGRTLLWVVVAVLALSVISALAAGFRASAAMPARVG